MSGRDAAVPLATSSSLSDGNERCSGAWTLNDSDLLCPSHPNFAPYFLLTQKRQEADILQPNPVCVLGVQTHSKLWVMWCTPRGLDAPLGLQVHHLRYTPGSASAPREVHPWVCKCTT